MSDKLDEVFDLMPAEVEYEENLPVVKEENLPSLQELDDEQNAREDQELARKTFRELIEKSSDMLEDLTSIARESEHPRAFEVASNLIKTISDVADKLNEHASKKTKKNDPQATGAVTNQQVNNMYLTSSEDLMKIIRQSK